MLQNINYFILKILLAYLIDKNIITDSVLLWYYQEKILGVKPFA